MFVYLVLFSICMSSVMLSFGKIWDLSFLSWPLKVNVQYLSFHAWKIVINVDIFLTFEIQMISKTKIKTITYTIYSILMFSLNLFYSSYNTTRLEWKTVSFYTNVFICSGHLNKCSVNIYVLYLYINIFREIFFQVHTAFQIIRIKKQRSNCSGRSNSSRYYLFIYIFLPYKSSLVSSTM